MWFYIAKSTKLDYDQNFGYNWKNKMGQNSDYIFFFLSEFTIGDCFGAGPH
jgi:hypothetical protein